MNFVVVFIRKYIPGLSLLGGNDPGVTMTTDCG